MKKLDFIPVILGSDLNAYGMSRAFHMEYGVKSYGLGKGRLFMTRNSSIISIEVCKDLDDDIIFLEKMMEIEKKLKLKAKKLILIASSDNYAELIIRNREKLKGYFEMPFTNIELMNRLIYKENFYQVCEEFGLDYPKTIVCKKENRDSFKLNFDFPVVLKASDSMLYFNCDFEGKKKAYIINDEEELRDVINKIYLSTYDDSLIIQEFIPGEDSNMRVLNTYSKNDGKVSMMCFGRPLLEDPSPLLVGNYVSIISEYNGEIYEKFKGFLEKIGYVGYGNFDMKYDERDGKYKVFEINLRQGRSSYFVTASGYNMAKYVVEDLIYDKNKDVEYGENEHLWLNVSKDVVLKYLKDKELKKRAKKLIKEKKYSETLNYSRDFNFKRWIDRVRYYRTYRKIFEKYAKKI